MVSSGDERSGTVQHAGSGWKRGSCASTAGIDLWKRGSTASVAVEPDTPDSGSVVEDEGSMLMDDNVDKTQDSGPFLVPGELNLIPLNPIGSPNGVGLTPPIRSHRGPLSPILRDSNSPARSDTDGTANRVCFVGVKVLNPSTSSA